MKTLAFATKAEAENRSRSEWERVLGRPKRPEDVTEFYFPVDGASVVVPEGDEARLTKAEVRGLRVVAAVEAAAEAEELAK